jgi:hypothetical protein
MAGSTKGRKPKVYWAEIDGLNDWIVAAPNRADALAAFGVRQDLFAQGAAGEAAEPDKIAAARKQPGVPLRRAKETNAEFAAPTSAADWSAAAPKGSVRSKKKADRTALDQAEARLEEIEKNHLQAMADIEQDRTRLHEREDRETRRYEAARSEAEAQRDDAAKVFKAAGGR